MPHLTINYLKTPNNCSNPVLIPIVPSPLHRVAIVACFFTLLFSLKGYSFSKSVWEETVITPPPKPIWNSLVLFSSFSPQYRMETFKSRVSWSNQNKSQAEELTKVGILWDAAFTRTEPLDWKFNKFNKSNNNNTHDGLSISLSISKL